MRTGRAVILGNGVNAIAFDEFCLRLGGVCRCDGHAGCDCRWPRQETLDVNAVLDMYCSCCCQRQWCECSELMASSSSAERACYGLGEKNNWSLRVYAMEEKRSDWAALMTRAQDGDGRAYASLLS